MGKYLPRQHRLKAVWKRLFTLAAGWGFIFVGIIGILLPVMPGIIFLIIGAYVLSLESFWLASKLDKIAHKYPKFAKINCNARVRARQILNRILTSN